MVYCLFHHFMMVTNPLRAPVASENQLSRSQYEVFSSLSPTSTYNEVVYVFKVLTLVLYN